MFLATTAIEEYWDRSQRIMFLGEWCRLYRRRHVWEAMDCEVLPYHWNDPAKLRSDFVYLGRVYETLLEKIARLLNSMHKVDHTVRYWRIIVGPWLRLFIEVVFDRYSCLAAAVRSGRISSTRIISNLDDGEWIPRSFGDFQNLVRSDAYNLFLYSMLISRQRDIPFDRVDQPMHRATEFQQSGRGLRVKERLKSYVRDFGNLLPHALREIVFVSSYFGRAEETRLMLSLGQYPFLFPEYAEEGRSRVDLGCRSSNAMDNTNDAFVDLLQGIVTFNLPTVYVEDYARTVESAVKKFPDRPAVIFTANAYAENEEFKFWAAEHIEQGTALVIGQHGGHNGIGALSAVEEHEIAIAGTYISWGWTSSSLPKVKPLPAQKLIAGHREKKLAAQKKIFWNLNSLPRYSYRLWSAPIGPQFLSYIDCQRAFVNQLCEGARENLVCRPYATDFDWDVIPRIRETTWKFNIDTRRSDWSELTADALLCIETSNTTTLLESMSSDTPTVLLLQPELWEIRDSAEPVFERLRRVGIYHIDPTFAAVKVNEVYRDPDRWWHEEQVQEARRIFCDRFARTSSQWLEEWTSAVKQIREERERNRGDGSERFR